MQQESTGGSKPAKAGGPPKSRIFIILAVLIIPIVVYFALPEDYRFGGNDEDKYAGYLTEVATRGSFQVGVTERGTIDSMQNSTLTNSVEGQTTIIEIVDEGTLVRAPIRSTIPGVVKVEQSDSVGQRSVVTVTVTAEDGEQRTFEGEIDPPTEDRSDLGRQVLVQDGDVVKPADMLIGDVVCVLDSSVLVDDEKQQQIAVTQAKADLEKASKNVEIQINQNESDIAAAELARDLAELDLKKFKDGEFQKNLAEAEGAVRELEEQLIQNLEQYEFSERNYNKGFVTLTQLERDRLAVLNTEVKLETARRSLELVQKYDYDRQIKELEQNAKEYKRELERVKLSGEAALAQFEAELKARELTYSVETNNLERLQKQIKACKLVATQDGEVVYANQQSRRSEPVVIEEGVAVRERQAIIKLPDLTKMKVDARIHESKISRVKVGQQALIRVDAYGEEVFYGVLETVSSIPLPGNWPNLDLKEYEAQVRLTDSIEKVRKLRPGLTAGLEIIVGETRPDVLQIPVQAVITVGDKYFSFVLGESGPERREILIGDTNDTNMEIKDGVLEGEKVIMNPRTHFSDQIAELEDEFDQRKADEKPTGPPEATPPAVGKTAPKAGGNAKARPKQNAKGGGRAQGTAE